MMRDDSIEIDELVKEPEKKNNLMLYIGILLLFIAIMLFIVLISSDSIREEPILEEVEMREEIIIFEDIKGLSEELRDKGFTLYTTSTCPHCKAQKEYFGEYLSNIDVVECDTNPDEVCPYISAVPTWKTADNILLIGGGGYESLKRMSDYCNNGICILPENNDN